MGRDRNENGTRPRASRAWPGSLGRPCWICRAMGLRGEIDYSLPPTHPYSFEVDHLVPVSMGGDLYDRDNIDATHRCCNQWRSNRSVEQAMEIARRRRHGRRGWGVWILGHRGREAPPRHRGPGT
jgi:hypothetical protein